MTKRTLAALGLVAAFALVVLADPIEDRQRETEELNAPTGALIQAPARTDASPEAAEPMQAPTAVQLQRPAGVQVVPGAEADIPGTRPNLDRFPPPQPPLDRRFPMIVNGQKAGPFDFPWTTMLTRKDHNATVCSGTLIKPTWILTAEHCLDTLNEGDHAHFRNIATPFVIKKTVPHPEDDVALLEVESAVPITPLPIGPAPATGDPAMILGFGRTEDHITGVLHFASVTIMDNADCVNSGLVVGAQTLCAGDPQSVVCFGDSGGPLVGNSGLVGVANHVSASTQCGPGVLGVRFGAFARVADYVTWVDEHTAPTIHIDIPQPPIVSPGGD